MVSFCIKHEASKAHAAAVARHKGFMEIKRAGKCDIIHQVTKDAQGILLTRLKETGHISKLSLIFCFSVRNKDCTEGRKVTRKTQKQGRHRKHEQRQLF